MKRRSFLKRAAAAPALAALAPHSLKGVSAGAASLPAGKYTPDRIVNEYNLLLPGEREALRDSPRVLSIAGGEVAAHLGNENKTLAVGAALGGWQLVALIPWLNGAPTAVFEKHVTHQGALAYVTELGEIASIPKRIG